MGLFKGKRSTDEIQRNIRDELAALLPLLAIEPCEIELAGFNEATGIGVIRFHGHCQDCNASVLTFIHGIQARLRLRVPELRELTIEPAR